MYFIELEKFGWNWLTASFVLLSILTTWQLRTYFVQARTVWQRRSARSLSVTMFTFQLFFMVAATIYGLSARSLVITYTGCAFPLIASIMIATWKFGRPNNYDKIVFALGVIGLLMYLSPIEAAMVYSVFAFTGMAIFGQQLRVLYQEKSRGDMRIGWLVIIFAKCILWNIFAFTAREPVYMIISPIFMVMVTSIIALWWYYPAAKNIVAQES